MDPNYAFLIQCMRQYLNRESTEVIPQNIHWQTLWQMAQNHKVMPLLCRCLLKKKTLSAEQRRYSRKFIHIHNAHCFFLMEHIRQLLKMFDDNQIPIIIHKGPALALIAYQDMAMRQFIDLDFIIPKNKIMAASALLAAQGYQLQFPGRQKTLILSGQGLVHYNKYIVVELNWTPFAFPDRKKADNLWKYQINIDKYCLPAVESEILLVLLCDHGAKHLWQRLAWILDIAMLCADFSPKSWHKTLKYATQTGNKKTLVLGLRLAEKILHYQIPPDIKKETPDCKSLVKNVEKYLPNQNVSRRSSFFFYIKTKERLGDRQKKWLFFLLAPSHEDLEFANLPTYLYCVVRPIRLAWKYLRKIFSSPFIKFFV